MSNSNPNPKLLLYTFKYSTCPHAVHSQYTFEYNAYSNTTHVRIQYIFEYNTYSVHTHSNIIHIRTFEYCTVFEYIHTAVVECNTYIFIRIQYTHVRIQYMFEYSVVCVYILYSNEVHNIQIQYTYVYNHYNVNWCSSWSVLYCSTW